MLNVNQSCSFLAITRGQRLEWRNLMHASRSAPNLTSPHLTSPHLT